MHADDRSPPEGRVLSPEEVGARVSAILEAAERDARAVIDAAQREAAAPEPCPPTLEGLAREVEQLRARVAALEGALAPAARHPLPDPHPPPARRERPGRVDPAARVRAIELALAGYSRDAIAHELSSSMPAADIAGLLDEVLSR